MPSQAMKNAPRGPKKPTPLKPNPGEACLECVMGSPVYVPCGKPAEYVVKQTDATVLPMCAADADHNIRNRGAKLLLEGDTRPPVPKIEREPLLGEAPDTEVEEAPPPSQEELAKVVELAKAFWKKQVEIDNAEAALIKLKEELTVIREVELPSAMTHVGIKDLGLQNGWRVSLKKIVAGNVTNDNKPRAYAWLEKHGFGDLIKRVVTVSFGKDESSWAKKFLADMAKRKKPLRAEIKEAVAPQTLQAFIRDRVEELNAGTTPPDKAIPKDLFGVFEKTVALLEDPAGKRA